MKDSHTAWFKNVSNSAKYNKKNETDAVNIDNSMARVRVAPINMPSHVNVTNPASGIAAAQ